MLYLCENISLGPSFFCYFKFLEEYLILDAFLFLELSDNGPIIDVFSSIL
jgi:hypothetical protein